jgi:hypothetical protein
MLEVLATSHSDLMLRNVPSKLRGPTRLQSHLTMWARTFFLILLSFISSAPISVLPPPTTSKRT